MGVGQPPHAEGEAASLHEEAQQDEQEREVREGGVRVQDTRHGPRHVGESKEPPPLFTSRATPKKSASVPACVMKKYLKPAARFSAFACGR